MNPNLNLLLTQLRESQSQQQTSSKSLDLNTSLLSNVSNQVIAEVRQEIHRTNVFDLNTIKNNPILCNRIKQLQEQQSQLEERLMSERKLILHKLKSDNQQVIRYELIEFDKRVIQELDKLCLNQQKTLAGLGLDMFFPTTNVKELDQQKWTLSVLLNSIKDAL